MGGVLFISDLHLSPERPATAELFLGFLAGRARGAQALYILGDLFDVWIGDDDRSAFSLEIIEALRALSESGTALHLMHGNRDFLIGRRFARATGCTLLKDPSVVELAGTPTLLMHGDLLCTDDVAYQRFRRKARNPIFQRLFLLKGLKRRRAIAADYRRKSGEATSLKSQEIMDVNQGTVESTMRQHGVSRLIHGHTHRPADHRFELDGKPVERIVLSEWHEVRGEVLSCSNGELRRETVTASA